MLFNSFIFFIFLGVVIPVFYNIKSIKSKQIFLLLTSYLFYGFWDWRFCLLIFLSTLTDYLVAQYIAKRNTKKTKRKLLYVSLFMNLGVLAIFKYFNFFIDSFTDLISFSGVTLDYLHLNIILPVGISFYTFQTLSYTIDVYRRKIEPEKDFICFALFVAFFPQLVAGPIERANRLLPQLKQFLKPSKNKIQEGIVLIIIGLFKKVMIGDVAGRYVDHIFSDVSNYPSFELLSALILFSIQIYADFSGYTSIARGTAKLLGIELMENFRQPYLSENITEFWRRWHISLSTWLKDYLYIPLGGNRRGKSRMYINLMLTMILGGLWHGASWNFIIWGGLHGIYLIIHKLVFKKKRVKHKYGNVYSIFNIFFTYLIVLFAWLFFRSPNFDTVKQFFSKIIYWETSEFSLNYFFIIFSLTVMIIVFDLLEKKNGKSFLVLKNKPMQYGILFGLFFIICFYMIESDPLPFVYFQF